MDTEAWGQLKEDEEVKHALCNQCMLCGAWVGPINELMTHLRETHPAYVATSCAKGAQLEQILREGARPVTVQIAMLLIYQPRAAQHEPRALHCELCHQQFRNGEAMQDHLRNVRATAIFEWNPVRDHVCRRCSARFTPTPGVRNHIMYGRCDNFDPHADCSPLPLDRAIAQALRDGRALEQVEDPMVRLSWTVQCMQCGQTYKRSNDFSAHI